MIVVDVLTKTCESCPAQWEGRTNDGREVYVRYRWGHLSVEIDGSVILEKEVGGPYDGSMDLTELAHHLRGVALLPHLETNEPVET